MLLDGVFGEDMSVPPSDESGVPAKSRKPTHPAGGKVTFGGEPLANALVMLYSYNARTKK